MKALLSNKLALLAIGGIIVVGVGMGIYFGVIKNNEAETNTAQETENTETKPSNDDFQRTGEKSFGLSVCDELSKEEVGTAIGKPILKTKDYSSGGSTGCEYYVTENSFVIVNVGYSDMANQRKGLEAIDRSIKTDDRIGLENMLVYSEKGLVDIYMNVAPTKKFVRVGRSSTTAVDEETLIKLAIATETKIRSFK